MADSALAHDINTALNLPNSSSLRHTDTHVVSMTCRIQPLLRKGSGKLPCVLNAVTHPNHAACR